MSVLITQLKVFGESLKAISAAENVLNATNIVDEEANELLAQSLAGYSLEATKAVAAQKEFDAKQINAILHAQGYKDELLKMTAEQVKTEVSLHKVATTQALASGTTSTLGTAFSGLGAKIKMTTTAMWQFLTTTPVGWALMAGSAIFGVVKLYDALTVSVEEQKEKLKEVQEEYDSVKRELSDLNSELDSTKNKIKELESLDKLSWVEQEELDNLREVTKQLELQKKLKMDEQLKASEKLYKENKKSYDVEFKGALGLDVAQLTADLKDGGIGLNQLDLDGNITNMIAALHYLEEEKSKLSNPEDFEEYDKYISDIITSLKNNGSEFLQTLSENKQNILEIASIRELTKDEQEFFNDLSSMQQMIYEYYSPATWNQLEFESIFDTTGIEKTKNELAQMAKAGELDAKTIEQWPRLNQAINECGIICTDGETKAEAFCNEIIAFATNTEEPLNDVVQNLEEVVDVTKNLNDTFSTVKDSYGVMRDFAQAMSENKLDESTLSSVAKLSDNLNNLVAGFYAGTTSADELYNVLTDHYNNDLQNYSEALIAKNAINSKFYDAIGLSSAEVVNKFYDDYGIDLSNCKNYNAAKLQIEQQTLEKISGAWSNYYDAQKKIYTSQMEQVGRAMEGAAKRGEEFKSPDGLDYEQLSKQVALYESAISELDEITFNGIKTNFQSTSDAISNAAKDASDKSKDYIESYMEFMEKSLDAGKIDYQNYTNEVSRFLKEMYDTGKISASEFFSYQETMLRKQLTIYQATLNAVTRRFDKEIDTWQNLIDEVEQENDALKEQEDKYDGVISAVNDLLEAKKAEEQGHIDALKNENDKIQEQINQYDAVLRVVEKVYGDEINAIQAQQKAIDDKINALREANSEEERGIELEKAKIELARAISQKNKYVFNGEQFVYQADQSSINDNKEQIKNLEFEQTISAMEKEKDALQETIDKLEQYKQKWVEIADAYRDAEDVGIIKNILGPDYVERILQNRDEDIEDFKNKYLNSESQINDNSNMIASYEEKIRYYDSLKEKWDNLSNSREESIHKQLAAEILGASWESDILNNRVATFDNFKNLYLTIQQQIEDNTSLIASYNEKIVYYQALKDQWNSLADEYKNSMEDQQAAMILGADWEEKILSGRIDVLNNFKNQFFSIQQAIADAAWNSANEQIKAAQEAQKSASGNIGAPAKPGFDDSDVALTNPGYNSPKNKDKYKVIDSHGSTISSGLDYGQANNVISASGKQDEWEIKKYSKGGIISNQNSAGDLDWLAKANGEDHTIFVKNGEYIIPDHMTDVFSQMIEETKSFNPAFDILNSIPTPLSLRKEKVIPVVQNVNLTLPNVKSQDDGIKIMKELQRLELDAYQYSYMKP